MLAIGKKPIKFTLKKAFKDNLNTLPVKWGYEGLSEFTFYRTYSRKKEDGTLETWADCVARVVEGVFSILKTHAISSNLPWNEQRSHKLAEESAERLFEFKWTPPGRGLWIMGTDYLWDKGGMALYNCTFASTENIDADLSKPFAFVMDTMMQGVGAGYDTDGAGKLIVNEPIGDPELIVVEDTREEWVEAISCLIDSYLEDDSNPILIDTHKVRAYGEPIKGFGGVASGPEPLIQGFHGIKEILDNRVNELITVSDIVDIMCIIGKIVVAGNVRRSALITLGDANNEEYINLKNWDRHAIAMGVEAPLELKEISEEDYNNYNNSYDSREAIAKKYATEKWSWKFGGWRWASNNSVYAKAGMDYEKYVDAIAQNGEPGFFWIDTAKNYGRLADGIDVSDREVKGLNPCVSGDTWVLTVEGNKQVKDLVGKPFKAIVNGEAYPSTEEGFWSTGVKPTYEVTLDNGSKVVATGNHKFLNNKDEWVELYNLEIGNTLQINNQKPIWDNEIGNHQEGYFIGQLIGDGTFSPDNKPIITLWVDKDKYSSLNDYGPYIYIQKWLATLPTRSAFLGLSLAVDTDKYMQVRASCSALQQIANKYGVYKLEKKVPEFGSLSFTKGLLQGLFDADGSVQGDLQKGVSIRLTQNNLKRLEAVQRLLLSLGIASKIYKDRKKEDYYKMPDGKGGSKDYLCKAVHELIITRDSIVIFNEQIGFRDNAKKDKLNTIINSYTRKPYKSKYTYKIVSIVPKGEEEVYDCTISEVHRFSANGLIAHNCAEIALESFETCNLNENYPANHEDYWDFQRTLKFSYLYSKAVTLMATNWPETNAIISKNRRIGCSLSGIQEAFIKFGRHNFLEWANDAYDYLGYLDKKYSDWLGIPKSKRRTTVKPSGTVSLLAGALPGIHHTESTSYFRLVRIATTSPLVQILKNSNYKIEPATSDPTRTLVVYFPVIVDSSLPTKKNVSIWQQFKDLADMQKLWADNAVSITVTFSKEEKNQIAACLSAFDSEIKSVSLLPFSDHGYEQAPYTAAPLEEVQQYADTLLPLDFSLLTSEGDNAESNKFCSNDSCEI